MNRQGWRGSCDLTAGTILEFALVTDEAISNIQNIPHPSWTRLFPNTSQKH